MTGQQHLVVAQLRTLKLKKLPRNAHSKFEKQIWQGFCATLRHEGVAETLIEDQWAEVRTAAAL